MDRAELARLAEWLGTDVTVDGRPTTGSSNVTWFVRIAGRPAVLRHPPRRDDRLPTAHDLLREARYLRALAGRGVPVPGVVVTCDDPDVIGVPFVITERMPGTCVLDVRPTGLDAGRVAGDAIDTLAAIHEVDVATTDLAAPSGSYLERQIERWSDQLRRTPTAPRLGDLTPIVAWLHANRPSGESRTIVHGDYGFHNLLVSATAVTAVLDWELATIGDPVADVFSFLKSWGPGANAPNPANDVLALDPASPSRGALLERYAALTGRDLASHTAFYDAFGVWRSIGIFEGIHARSGGTRFIEETPRLVATIRAMMGGRADPR